ncbi:hypothetical protein NADRNF5_1283 [Nitrosopumilus adriaticus]|uniref:Uncharacterized protein n=1 Tax=Nitrosopumilus adriaticus TaxID=1580092 RepID=A0A0D5C3Q2_9ARCH|nr:hypothetical protein NADRNF5_1283 [Nitrosopumilus adriaticus]
MKEIILQMGESLITESFDSTNNIFEEFRLFSSSLFFQIMDMITPMFQNLVK